MTMTETQWDDDEADEAFLRQLIRPEEDRRRYGHAPWVGGFRWFRSPNVIPLEQWRNRRHNRCTTQPRGN
jgi:hypothetical protein